jgi:hypothetical protein
MTVKELIEHLKTLDETKPIYVAYSDNGMFKVVPITNSNDDPPLLGYLIDYEANS